jgi:hypothetical protein
MTRSISTALSSLLCIALCLSGCSRGERGSATPTPDAASLDAGRSDASTQRSVVASIPEDERLAFFRFEHGEPLVRRLEPGDRIDLLIIFEDGSTTGGTRTERTSRDSRRKPPPRDDPDPVIITGSGAPAQPESTEPEPEPAPEPPGPLRRTLGMMVLQNIHVSTVDRGRDGAAPSVGLVLTPEEHALIRVVQTSMPIHPLLRKEDDIHVSAVERDSLHHLLGELPLINEWRRDQRRWKQQEKARKNRPVIDRRERPSREVRVVAVPLRDDTVFADHSGLDPGALVDIRAWIPSSPPDEEGATEALRAIREAAAHTISARRSARSEAGLSGGTREPSPEQAAMPGERFADRELLVEVRVVDVVTGPGGRHALLELTPDEAKLLLMTHRFGWLRFAPAPE